MYQTLLMDKKMSIIPQIVLNPWNINSCDVSAISHGFCIAIVTWCFSTRCGIKAGTCDYGVQLTISHSLVLLWDYTQPSALWIPMAVGYCQLHSMIIGSCYIPAMHKCRHMFDMFLFMPYQVYCCFIFILGYMLIEDIECRLSMDTMQTNHYKHEKTGATFSGARIVELCKVQI